MKYFYDDDFLCECGCKMDVTDEVKLLSDKIRALAGIPLIVNSGARCSAHNNAIGASETSSHTLGLAVDFKCTDSHSRANIIRALVSLGISRIGLHKNFVHYDIDRRKPTATWFY